MVGHQQVLVPVAVEVGDRHAPGVVAHLARALAGGVVLVLVAEQHPRLVLVGAGDDDVAVAIAVDLSDGDAADLVAGVVVALEHRLRDDADRVSGGVGGDELGETVVVEVAGGDRDRRTDDATDYRDGEDLEATGAVAGEDRDVGRALVRDSRVLDAVAVPVADRDRRGRIADGVGRADGAGSGGEGGERSRDDGGADSSPSR